VSVVTFAKPKTAIEKRTRTTVDTIMITPDMIAKWKIPTGQRPLRENAKVLALAEQLKLDKGTSLSACGCIVDWSCFNTHKRRRGSTRCRSSGAFSLCPLTALISIGC